MRKFKQTAVIGGVLGLMAGVAAAFGPFFSGEAVEGMIERIRRSLPLGEQPPARDNPVPGEDDAAPPETAET